MHIVILSHNYPFLLDNTYGFFCKQQAEALASFSGHSIGVVIPLPYSIKYIFVHRKILVGAKRFIENNVNTNLYYFPSLPKLKRLKYFFIKRIGIHMMRKYIERNGKPDIIHLHTFLAAEVAQYFSLLHGIKIIWTEHFTDFKAGTLNVFEKYLVDLAVTISNVRIGVSVDFAHFLQLTFNKKFEYIPNVYDSNIFVLSNKLRDKGVFKFINVGHLSARKNQAGLLRAFHRSFAGTSVKITFVGEGATSRAFRSLVISLDLKDQVDLYGSLPSVQVYQLMLSSNVFVLASEYETFGVVLIEAMAAGLPVISTKSGGPESIIINNKIGLLTEKNENSLADAMHFMYENYNSYDSAYIAQVARDNYSYSAIAKKLFAQYIEVLGQDVKIGNG